MEGCVTPDCMTPHFTEHNEVKIRASRCEKGFFLICVRYTKSFLRRVSRINRHESTDDIVGLEQTVSQLCSKAWLVHP